MNANKERKSDIFYPADVAKLRVITYADANIPSFSSYLELNKRTAQKVNRLLFYNGNGVAGERELNAAIKIMLNELCVADSPKWAILYSAFSSTYHRIIELLEHQIEIKKWKDRFHITDNESVLETRITPGSCKDSKYTTLKIYRTNCISTIVIITTDSLLNCTQSYDLLQKHHIRVKEFYN